MRVRAVLAGFSLVSISLAAQPGLAAQNPRCTRWIPADDFGASLKVDPKTHKLRLNVHEPSRVIASAAKDADRIARKTNRKPATVQIGDHLSPGCTPSVKIPDDQPAPSRSESAAGAPRAESSIQIPLLTLRTAW